MHGDQVVAVAAAVVSAVGRGLPGPPTPCRSPADRASRERAGGEVIRPVIGRERRAARGRVRQRRHSRGVREVVVARRAGASVDEDLRRLQAQPHVGARRPRCGPVGRAHVNDRGDGDRWATPRGAVAGERPSTTSRRRARPLVESRTSGLPVVWTTTRARAKTEPVVPAGSWNQAGAVSGCRSRRRSHHRVEPSRRPCRRRWRGPGSAGDGTGRGLRDAGRGARDDRGDDRPRTDLRMPGAPHHVRQPRNRLPGWPPSPGRVSRAGESVTPAPPAPVGFAARRTRIDRYAELVVRVGAAVRPGSTVYLTAEVEHLPLVRAITAQAYLAGPRGRRPHRLRQNTPGRSRPRAARRSPRTSRGRRAARQRGACSSASPARPTRTRSTAWRLSGLTACPVSAARRDDERRRQPDDRPGAQRGLGASGLRRARPGRWGKGRRRAAARRADRSLPGSRAGRAHGARRRTPSGSTPCAPRRAPDLRRTETSGPAAVCASDGRTYIRTCRPEVFTSPDRPCRRRHPAHASARDTARRPRGRGSRRHVRGSTSAPTINAKPCVPNSPPTTARRASTRCRWSTGTSRVRARAGVVFHDTLYDANAGCHVAWGQGFPFAVADGLAKSRPEARGGGAQLLGSAHRRRGRRTRRRRASVPTAKSCRSPGDAWVLPVD